MKLKSVKEMTINEVKAEIKSTNEDWNHPYWIDHPKHEIAVGRMENLYKKLYPPDKSDSHISYNSALGALVDFLNIDFKSPLAWRRWQRHRSVSSEKINQSDELNNAQDLQSEIKNDLSPIADFKEIPEKFHSFDERWINLCEKLNEMNFQRYWRVDMGTIPGRKEFFIPKFESWNLSRNDREKWYALIGHLLEVGEIQRLRKCSECKKFFEARDRRARFCKTKCKDDYHNRESGAERKEKSRIKRIIEEGRILEERKKGA